MVWDVSRTLIQLGPIEIRYYGLIFATTTIIAYLIFRWQMLRGGHTEKQCERYLLLSLICIIGGARLGHCLFYEPAKYLAHPLQILYVWRGGLASHGAMIGLILVNVYFAWSEKINLIEIMDRGAISTALFSMTVRLGNLFNSEIVGRVTGVPWGVKFPLYPEDRYLSIDRVPFRHPSQIYEFGIGLAIFLILYFTDRKLKEERPLGLLISMYFLLYAPCRFLVEFVKEFQAPSDATFPLTMGQILSVPFLLIGIVGIVLSLTKNIPTSSLRPAPAAGQPLMSASRKRKEAARSGRK